jgi:hypothetical protein
VAGWGSSLPSSGPSVAVSGPSASLSGTDEAGSSGMRQGEWSSNRPATERKDLVNIIVLIGAGTVGALTAFAAILNAYISSRNLQNAQEALRQERALDERRSQDDALQAYFKQIGELLTDHKLKEAQPENAVSMLARAQTLTVLRRLDAERKKDLLLFLYGAELIRKDDAVVNLLGARLTGAPSICRS